MMNSNPIPGAEADSSWCRANVALAYLIMTSLDATIECAVQGTAPHSVARMRALASVRWILATNDGQFVRVDNLANVELVSSASQATVYDGRDNEEVKVRFFESLLRVSLTVVLLG